MGAAPAATAAAEGEADCDAVVAVDAVAVPQADPPVPATRQTRARIPDGFVEQGKRHASSVSRKPLPPLGES